jgi:hypothetical protein
MQIDKISKKSSLVDKAFNIKIETQFIHSEYVLNSEKQEIIGDTGLLRVFELKPLDNKKASFVGRWDHGKQIMDIDIYNTDSNTRKSFLKSKNNYEGHHPDFIDKNNRTFEVLISILGENIYKGLVFFNINHSVHLGTGKYGITGNPAEFKIIRGQKSDT